MINSSAHRDADSALRHFRWRGQIRFVALTLVCVVLMNCSSNQPIAGPVPRTLVVGVDGVAFTTFKKLQDGGHFRNFLPVAPMVATFPSISDPDWTLIMGLPPEPSYTKAFFDPTIKTDKGMGMENGSLMAHLSREPGYERVMDFKVDGLFEHLSMFVWTDTTAKYWLESLEKKFFSFTGRNTYFALIVNTDIVSHTEGELSLMKYLGELEKTIEKIQTRYKDLYGQDLEVVMVSDHGNAYFSPQDIPYEDALKDMGWSLQSTLSGPHDVGFYVPEMLGFGAFYALPASHRNLARDLAKVAHVQSTMYEPHENEIHIFSDHGHAEAEILVNPKKETVDFKILTGIDPYGHAKYFAKGPLKFREYFEKTLDETYPDALVRIWEGYHIDSRIKPHVLVNAEYGFVFGNAALRMMTNLRGFSSSHGSLHRNETLGIFTSTKKQMPPIRPQDFRKIVDFKGFYEF